MTRIAELNTARRILIDLGLYSGSTKDRVDALLTKYIFTLLDELEDLE